MVQTPIIDHHLQAAIVKRLFLQSPLVFSNLKPADVENSLFMYHVRKLVSRGIVEKAEAGFQLTPVGFQWANEMNKHTDLQPHRGPRFLVQFIIIANNSVLLSRRQAPIATHIQEYLLPGRIIKFGQTSSERAQQAADELGVTLQSQIIGHAEIIDTIHNHHAVIDYYLATADPGYDADFDDIYNVAFRPLNQLESYGPQVSEPLKKYLESGPDFSLELRITE